MVSLTFEKRPYTTGRAGDESSLPDLVGNSLHWEAPKDLACDPQVKPGYGRRFTSYPYRQQACYSRKLSTQHLLTAILENEFLRAEFLPPLGGRLWRLYDKEHERDILYTNDVLRYSNLAVCNAWFSGGVEWNPGIIGHSPFTCRPLWTEELKTDDGASVLRMYEYERVRRIVYQMDFSLAEGSRFLEAHMTVSNLSGENIPMYWWSNMAVPEYPNGRLVVPADMAYTGSRGGIEKIPVPVVDGVEVSHYGSIPHSVDYFFDIPANEPKYTANIGPDGYGLVQFSDDRLQSRKLFSWGHNRGSANWQKFLTEDAGWYIETQAGLSKTQYACMEMPAGAVWDWTEFYGSMQSDPSILALDYTKCREIVTKQVLSLKQSVKPSLKAIACKSADKTILAASGYGYLHDLVCSDALKTPSHLHFGPDAAATYWEEFLSTGSLPAPDPREMPVDYLCEPALEQKLASHLKTELADNWYAWYQEGLYLLDREDLTEAECLLHSALSLSENAWTLHALGSVLLRRGRNKEAALCLKEGILSRPCDLSYLKEAAALLLKAGGSADWLSIYPQLSSTLRHDGRLTFYYLTALRENGRALEAYNLLASFQTMFLDDVREGETCVSALYEELSKELGRNEPAPDWMIFRAVR